VREIRRIKARVEAERIPRGADRALHLKLGPGGLSDVEWTVQLFQLRHGYEVPGLRTTRTLGALGAAMRAGLVGAADADALSASWVLASRIRNAIMLVRGRQSDTLPTRHDELTAVARLLGYRGSPLPGTVNHGNAFGRTGALAPGTPGTPGALSGSGAPAAWGDTPAQALEQDYRRTARHARAVMDRLFYG
jgi:glutamine synthetase adenylyltransferase